MPTQLVMVYGSLLEGLHNHSVLNYSGMVGYHKTDSIYTMISLGGFPGVLKRGKTSIKGEVYEVDLNTFKALDRLEGHPTFYHRELIDTPYGEAWIYILTDHYQHGIKKEVADGDWREYYERTYK